MKKNDKITNQFHKRKNTAISKAFNQKRTPALPQYEFLHSYTCPSTLFSPLLSHWVPFNRELGPTPFCAPSMEFGHPAVTALSAYPAKALLRKKPMELLCYSQVKCSHRVLTLVLEFYIYIYMDRNIYMCVYMYLFYFIFLFSN